MQLILIIAAVAIAFLLGGIPSGLWIARAWGVSDIRAHGSGNIGATNVWRVVGPKAAVWVYVADIGKGVIAVLIARFIEQDMISRDLFLVIVALAAVFGHIFSPFVGFKGGKGVNTALGVLLVLLPIEVLVSLGVFVLVVAISRYISLGSITAATVLPLTLVFQSMVLRHDLSIVYLVLTLVLTAAVILTHRKNIGRLLAGTESRFSLSSKPKSGAQSHV